MANEEKEHNLQQLYYLLAATGRLDHSRTPSKLKHALCDAYWEVKRYCDTRQKLPVTVYTSWGIPCAEERNLKKNCSNKYPSDSDENLCTSKNASPSRSPSNMSNASPVPVGRFYSGSGLVSVLKSNENILHSAVMKPSSEEHEKIQHILPESTPMDSPKSLSNSTDPMKDTPVIKKQGLPTLKSTKTPIGTPKSKTGKRNTEKNPELGIGVNLHKHILTGKKHLKGTPDVKRSPGGTPVRKKRPLCMTNPGDVVAYALQKKFGTLRQLYGSPNQGGTMENGDGSFNISID